MNIPSLLKADRLLGVPLCFILTQIRYLFSRRPKKIIRRILIIKFAEQGSTVLAISAIRQAVEKVGRENVLFLVFKEHRFILDALDLIPSENIITISLGNVMDFLKTAFTALIRIRRAEIDAVVDMEFFARSSAAIAFLSGASNRVGFHSFYGAGPYRGDLMTHRILYNPHLHTSQTFRCLIQALDCDPKLLPTANFQPFLIEPLPQLTPRAAELEGMRALLCDLFGQSEVPRLVIMNPNAGDLLPLRKWPIERYAELARRVLAEFDDVFIVLTGTPSEADAIEKLVSEIHAERCVSLANKTTLPQLFALYHLAEVMVTNDSGPAHFASLTPIHSVTLFGPETPALYRSLTERNVPLWAGIACSPCINAYNNRQTPCRNNLCMQAITVDTVFAEVSRLLARCAHKLVSPSSSYNLSR